MWIESASIRISLYNRLMAISMSPIKLANSDHYFVTNFSPKDISREPKYLVLEYLEYIKR